MNSKVATAIATDFSHTADEAVKSRKMPERLQGLLNDQFMRELGAAHLYLSIASYFEELGLTGFSRWMRMQMQEEQAHAMKIFQFLHDRGVRPQVGTLTAPFSSFDSPIKAIEKALEQECLNTLALKEIYGAANSAHEFEITAFLQWFLQEQVEEEASVSKILQDLQRSGDRDATALLYLDRELGGRSS